MGKYIDVFISTDVNRTPEDVVDELYKAKEGNDKLFYKGENHECKVLLDGVLLTTEDTKDVSLRKYYNNVLEAEEKINSNLEDTRFRNVKCAALNLRSIVDKYDLSAHEKSDQDLFLKRIIVNMQRAYNMEEELGSYVSKDFPGYLDVLMDTGKVVEYETRKKNFHHDDLIDEAITYINQVKEAPVGKEKDAFLNICMDRENGSIAKQWLNDFSNSRENTKNKSM